MATPRLNYMGMEIPEGGINTTARPQAAPVPAAQPFQPQQVPGIGEFLAGLAQAYSRQGLAAPGHGVNQNIADRQKIEGQAAGQQRQNFNDAFPRGRGQDGLVQVPQFDRQLFNQGEAARIAGGDPRRIRGDQSVPANRPQVTFARPFSPLGKGNYGAWNGSIQTPPPGLGQVLDSGVSVNGPARGADFVNPRTGTSQGLVSYEADDDVKYSDANAWTAQGGLSPNQTGPRQGAVISEGGQPLFNAPVSADSVGAYLAANAAPDPEGFRDLNYPPEVPPPMNTSQPPTPVARPGMGDRQTMDVQIPVAPDLPSLPPPLPRPAQSAPPTDYRKVDPDGYVDYSNYPRGLAPLIEPGEWMMNFWHWLGQPQGSNK